MVTKGYPDIIEKLNCLKRPKMKLRFIPTDVKDFQQENILKKAQQELYLVKREIDLSEKFNTLEAIFYTHGKHAMISAKFYHECMVLNIPCVLDVHTQYGEVDAIVELNDRYFIIEFKSSKKLAHEKHTEYQVKRYLNLKYPVMLIYQHEYFSHLLCQLQSKIFEDKIYFFEDRKFKIYDISTSCVDN